MTNPAPRTTDPRFNVVDARFVLGIVDASTMPGSELPEVAFAGRSNVGKSSLLNTLTRRKGLARTSSTPGCTRQINVFEIKLGDGVGMRFVDLPGFGYAKRSKQERVQWGTLIEGYLQRTSLTAMVLLVDVRRGLQEEELQLVEYLRVLQGPEFPCLIVLTKIDKVSRADVGRAQQAVKQALGRKALAFSAQTGDGREELWLAVRRAMQVVGKEGAEAEPLPPSPAGESAPPKAPRKDKEAPGSSSSPKARRRPPRPTRAVR